MGEPFAIGRGSDPPGRREHPPLPPNFTGGGYSQCMRCGPVGPWCGPSCPWEIAERAKPRPEPVIPDYIHSDRTRTAGRRLVAWLRWILGKD